MRRIEATHTEDIMWELSRRFPHLSFEELASNTNELLETISEVSPEGQEVDEIIKFDE